MYQNEKCPKVIVWGWNVRIIQYSEYSVQFPIENGNDSETLKP